MAAEAGEAQQLANALILAATQAADAMNAMTAFQQAQQAQTNGAQDGSTQGAANVSSKFSHAGKMVRMPDPFSAVGVDAEQAEWPDFLLNLQAWLFAAESKFEDDLRAVEAHLDDEFDVDVQPDEVVQRGKELHSIFIGLLRNRSLKILRSVTGRNGYEVYRQLVKLYTPNTRPRSMAILSAIMSLPAFGKEKSLFDHVQGLDRLISEYQKACGQTVPEEVALSVLIRCLPAHIKQHIQLSLDGTTKYSDVRSRILGFESVTNNWTAGRIHSEFGIGSSSSNGPMPMEIDRVQDKGYFKGGKGKGKKGKDSFGQKGKGKDGVKGKGKYNSHGSGKGGKGKDDRSSKACLYCGKLGHFKRDCRKFLYDQKNGNVRQVEEQSQNPVPPAAADNSSQSSTSCRTSQPGASSSSSSHVRRVELAPLWEENEDLDITFTHHNVDGCIRAVSFDVSHDCSDMVSHEFDDIADSAAYMGASSSCAFFDLTYSDSDADWTYDLEAVDSLRVFESIGGATDIILDSGADGSALPLSYSNVGVSSSSSGAKPCFLDAQGNPLDIQNTRLAAVHIDDDILLHEEFIVATVTSPLISLGRLLKRGWFINTDAEGLHLFKDGKRIPVSFKRNSLCITGRIRVVEQEASHLRTIELQGSLTRVKNQWKQLGPHCFAIKTFRPETVDPNSSPARTMLWYRTTLIKRRGTWDVFEHNQPVSELAFTEYDLPNSSTVEEVITIGHDGPCTAGQLGFQQVTRPLDLLEPESGSSGARAHSSSSASGVLPDIPEQQFEDEQPDVDVPMSSASHDPLPKADDEPLQLEAAPTGPDEILIEGVVLTTESSLSALRAGCNSLGVSAFGNRKQLFRRMMKHLQERGLLASHSLKHQLLGESERPVHEPTTPVEPSEIERREHNLVHIPFKPWCQLCIANKSRQDKHHNEPHDTSAFSLISFDFGFSSRVTGDADKLTILCVHDRATKLIHSIPAEQKGGKSFQYLLGELCRFIMWTGHQTISLRSDNEPSCLALIEGAKKYLRGVGIQVNVETVVPGNKQANGAVESTIQVVRNQANLLIQQIEQLCGCEDKILFSSAHPMYQWAVIHACWLLNRYNVTNGETAFERCTGREYRGQLCNFGECVMGFFKPTAKGLPKWYRGVWLGRTFSNDGNIVACRGGLFITRSVRRIPNPWSLDELGQVEITPQECSFGSLGTKLAVPKRVVPPEVLPAVALPPAVTPVGSTMSPFSPDEAASDPPTPMPLGLSTPVAAASAMGHATPITTPALVAPGISDAMMDSDVLPQAGQAVTATMKPPPPLAAVAGPATPSAARGQVRSDDAVDEGTSKRQRIFCIINGNEFAHEDDHNLTSFTETELDNLEAYDYDSDMDDEYYTSADISNQDSLLQSLIFPFSDQEPNIHGLELAAIDKIAEEVEISRLKDLGVLLPPETLDGQCPKRLSTRFVTTWRDKTINGCRKWLRRARYVAREYAWLTPERQDLFSPASSNVTCRLLPSMFLFWKSQFPQKQFCMSAVDITDAFLTVTQIDPTLVACGDRDFALGKVLPGQRSGSQMWYDSVTSFLHSELGIISCPAYPSLLKSSDPNHFCVVLLHVDDMLILSEENFFDSKLIPTLTKRYKASVHKMSEIGDSFEFLKRKHTLVEDDVIHTQQNPRHYEKLFEVVGITSKMKAKKTPCHDVMTEEDKTEYLDSTMSSAYRSAIGILMYLASDLVECAYTIRGLAQCMSKPTERSWMMLKHLCLYLLDARTNSLQLKIKPNGLWYSPETSDGIVLELFSDSDWAAHKATRRSVSACMIFFQGCMLHASSRTQRVVALSSAEAELHSAVSCVCDGILLKHCVVFCLDRHIRLKLILDNSAAKQVLFRSGVGRIRHLSCRILWIQQYVKEKLLEVAAIPTKWNCSDLCTKKLSKARMDFLMNMASVYDNKEDDLVGAQIMAREIYSEEFRGALRTIREVCGIGRATHQHNLMAKSALQYMMMASIIAGGSANALSLESPIDDVTSNFGGYQDGIIAFYDLHFNYFDGYLRFEYIFAGMVVYILITGIYFCMIFCKKLLTYFHREKSKKLQAGKSTKLDTLTYDGEHMYLDASTPELRLILPEEVFVTPSGEKFHLKGCKHVRGNFKTLTPCKDCHCKLQKA